MAYNTYNSGFPVTYNPVMPAYSAYALPQYGNAYQGQQVMQPNPAQQQGMNGQQYNQQYSNQYNPNQYSQQQSPIQQFSQQNNQNMNTNDIVWIQDEQEVFNYPVASNACVMFISMNQMKLYTKEGSTGLIRDFELHETPDSIQRYQQLQQTQNMQFPIVDNDTNAIDYEQQSQVILDTLEKKLDEKLVSLEERLSGMMNNRNDTDEVKNKVTTTKAMTKRGGN